MKQKLARAINQMLDPIRERRAKIAARPGYVRAVIEEGSRKARAVAEETMERLVGWAKVPYARVYEPVPNAEGRFMGGGLAFHRLKFAEVTALTRMGMPGVWTWAFGEGFGHHYTESVATNHNAIGRGYETFGNASAETMARNRGAAANIARVTGKFAAHSSRSAAASEACAAAKAEPSA